MFRPDVIVQGTDRPQLRLAVEIHTERAHLDEAARQLRQYMSDEACPLGLLITPEETHVYRETWSNTPDSIRKLAVVETPVLINARGIIEDGPELERAVRQWLETMARHPGVPRHQTGEAARVEDYLLPALVDAEVWVTGPR